MRHPRILAKILNEPWLILPEMHRVIVRAVLAEEEGARADGDLDDLREMFGGPAPEVTMLGNGVGVLPVHGVLGKRLSNLEMACGGVDAGRLADTLDAQRSNADLETLLVEWNSPGGTVTGTPEAAEAMRGLAKRKRVVSWTSDIMASAAYWIGAQAGEVYASPSASVGSVGVYMAWLDYSEALAADGVAVHAVQAGKLKLAGTDFRPPSAEELGHFQAGVDSLHADFKRAIRHRMISSEHLEGQVLSGRAAESAGMVDGLAWRMAEVI